MAVAVTKYDWENVRYSKRLRIVMVDYWTTDDAGVVREQGEVWIYLDGVPAILPPPPIQAIAAPPAVANFFGSTLLDRLSTFLANRLSP